jgi:hypothetical protein
VEEAVLLEAVMKIHDTFEAGVDPRWQIRNTGSSEVIHRHGSLHLTLIPGEEPGCYSSVELSEYQPQQRNFQFKPPVRMKVRAYSSLHPSNMRGSAGFGFWNHPLDAEQPDFGRPLGLGFSFATPPAHLDPTKNIAAYGLRALVMDVQKWQFTPLIPVKGMAMIRNPKLQQMLTQRERKTGSLSECWLNPTLLTAEHEYCLEWRPDGAIFSVDGEVVHTIERVPQNALGFVARIDNQTSVITQRGDVILGRVPVKRAQALVLTGISIEPL